MHTRHGLKTEYVQKWTSLLETLWKMTFLTWNVVKYCGCCNLHVYSLWSATKCTTFHAHRPVFIGARRGQHSVGIAEKCTLPLTTNVATVELVEKVVKRCAVRPTPRLPVSATADVAVVQSCPTFPTTLCTTSKKNIYTLIDWVKQIFYRWPIWI